MINFEARFVTRSDGTLMIGALSKTSSLKPDTVYEIQQILGVYVIKEVGRSVVPSTMQDQTPGKILDSVTWCSSIENIINCFGKTLYLTTEEFESLEKENE